MIFAGHDLIHAVQFAEAAHREQKRRYTNEPYLVHLLSVAKMISTATLDKSLEEYREQMIIAALLHDTVEDTTTTLADIRQSFGTFICQLVAELTDPPLSEGNREKRKQLSRDRLSSASDTAKIIKCADIIDNMHSIVCYDPKFGKVFLKEVGVLIPLLETPRSSLYRKVVELHKGFSPQTTAQEEGKDNW